MSDYLGPTQSRVLDPVDRSFEEVVYQYRKPPLSSEVNLTGQLVTDRGRNLVQYLVPSGWALVGDRKNGVSESQALVGDILCSSSYTANTFKLMALDRGVETKKLVAWVNGHHLLVQGSSSTDENNIITLAASPSFGSRIDFVFLEVWRKLLDTNDTVYKHGNVLYGGTNFSNDLVDPAIGIETSLRVQVQYRIRVVEGVDIEQYPEGFDPSVVFVQGPLSSPISTCSHSYFSAVDGDPGLWRAGAGDSVAQETLQTVDGYTYAIPMFAVARRNTSDYDPDSRSNGAGRSLADYALGYASDRPDNKYNNWIVADDIQDLRHRVIPDENYEEICADGFKKLVANQLHNRMTKSTLGEDHFGVKLVGSDAVSNVDKAGSDKIATPDGIRRVFSNAEATQTECYKTLTINDKITGTPGAAWALNDEVQFTLSGYPVGSTIDSVEEVILPYPSVTASNLTVSSLPSASLLLTVASGSNVIGTTKNLNVRFTVTIPAGPNGLTAVPDTFLEFRPEDSTQSIAIENNDIRVRAASPVSTSDGTRYHMLSNRGARLTEDYDFGHQMIYHAVGNGTNFLTLPRSVEGYGILGVSRVLIDGVDQTATSVTRTASTYTVGFSASVASGKDVSLYLYTDSKFFDVHKQTRSISDSYAMTELSPIATGSSVEFKIDATDQTILALASAAWRNGRGIAYENGTQVSLSTTNEGFPVDTTSSRITVVFDSAPASGATLEIPILQRSAVGASEGYTCFYEKTPYQGLLDSTVTGDIRAVGPAITTTSGSGSNADYTYSEGTVISDGVTVYGINTEWIANVQPGDVFKIDSSAQMEYLVDSVYDDDTLTLTTDATWSGPDTYSITRPDVSYYGQSNIIDRLPTLISGNDASGMNEGISTAVTDSNPVLETRIVSRPQDIVDATDAVIGVNTADRGRSTINVNGNLGLGNEGINFEKLDSSGYFQKSYQSYVLDESSTGVLRLMVAASETDWSSASRLLNPRSNNDTVDIFDLPGRPLTSRKI